MLSREIFNLNVLDWIQLMVLNFENKSAPVWCGSAKCWPNCELGLVLAKKQSIQSINQPQIDNCIHNLKLPTRAEEVPENTWNTVEKQIQNTTRDVSIEKVVCKIHSHYIGTSYRQAFMIKTSNIELNQSLSLY